MYERLSADKKSSRTDLGREQLHQNRFKPPVKSFTDLPKEVPLLLIVFVKLYVCVHICFSTMVSLCVWGGGELIGWCDGPG